MADEPSNEVEEAAELLAYIRFKGYRSSDCMAKLLAFAAAAVERERAKWETSLYTLRDSQIDIEARNAALEEAARHLASYDPKVAEMIRALKTETPNG